MTKRPEVGDTVIIEGVVTSVSGVCFFFKTPKYGTNSPEFMHQMHLDRIKEIIPKPWAPKVGDMVYTPTYRMSGGIELRAIFGEYAVIWWSDHSGAPKIEPLSSVYKDKELTICAV